MPALNRATDGSRGGRCEGAPSSASLLHYSGCISLWLPCAQVTLSFIPRRQIRLAAARPTRPTISREVNGLIVLWRSAYLSQTGDRCPRARASTSEWPSARASVLWRRSSWRSCSAGRSSDCRPNREPPGKFVRSARGVITGAGPEPWIVFAWTKLAAFVQVGEFGPVLHPRRFGPFWRASVPPSLGPSSTRSWAWLGGRRRPSCRQGCLLP